MKIILREINRDNWEHCIRLQVPQQHSAWMPPNVFTLAETKFLPERVPLGIYHGDTIVGLVVCSYNGQLGRAWIHRLMIDANQQGKGYSRATMMKILRRLKRIPGCTVIGVDYRPGNEDVERFYEHFGFVKNGQATPIGDVIALLKVEPKEPKDEQTELQEAEPQPTSNGSSLGIIPNFADDDAEPAPQAE